MVTDADQHHLHVDHNNLGRPLGMARLNPTCDRAELPKPRHSDAKQLDVYNTSQPLPSSLTEVYSNLHLLGRGVPAGQHGPITNCTMPPSSLMTMPQLTPTPMPTPVTHSNPKAHSFRTPTDVHAEQWRFQIVSLKNQANIADEGGA